MLEGRGVWAALFTPSPYIPNSTKIIPLILKLHDISQSGLLCNISFGERVPLFKENLELENCYSRTNTGLLFLTDSGGFVFGKAFINPHLDLDDSLP